MFSALFFCKLVVEKYGLLLCECISFALFIFWILNDVDPLCLGADLILSVLLALGCPCGHLQLQDVASLLIFGPSQVFACELKLDLKFCTICKLACLDQQEPLWFQFTCMCRMMLKFTEAEIIYGHVQPSISSFIIYIFISRPSISRFTICLLLCEKLGQWLPR